MSVENSLWYQIFTCSKTVKNCVINVYWNVYVIFFLYIRRFVHHLNKLILTLNQRCQFKRFQLTTQLQTFYWCLSITKNVPIQKKRCKKKTNINKVVFDHFSVVYFDFMGLILCVNRKANNTQHEHQQLKLKFDSK